MTHALSMALVVRSSECSDLSRIVLDGLRLTPEATRAIMESKQQWMVTVAPGGKDDGIEVVGVEPSSKREQPIGEVYFEVTVHVGC
jgi:hypothetical protein